MKITYDSDADALYISLIEDDVSTSKLQNRENAIATLALATTNFGQIIVFLF